MLHLIAAEPGKMWNLQSPLSGTRMAKWLTMSRSGTVAGSQNIKPICNGNGDRSRTALRPVRGRSAVPPQKQNRKIAKSAQQGALIYSVASGTSEAEVPKPKSYDECASSSMGALLFEFNGGV